MKVNLSLHNHQRAHAFALSRLQIQALQAFELLQKEWRSKLTEVQIYFISEKKMIQLHRDFCNDPTPTDVITFHHGEIFICPAVAQCQRKAQKLSLNDELLTYIIHGLLHLCGWNDLTVRDFEKMRKRQEKILRTIT